MPEQIEREQSDVGREGEPENQKNSSEQTDANGHSGARSKAWTTGPGCWSIVATSPRDGRTRGTAESNPFRRILLPINGLASAKKFRRTEC